MSQRLYHNDLYSTWLQGTNFILHICICTCNAIGSLTIYISYSSVSVPELHLHCPWNDRITAYFYKCIREYLYCHFVPVLYLFTVIFSSQTNTVKWYSIFLTFKHC